MIRLRWQNGPLLIDGTVHTGESTCGRYLVAALLSYDWGGYRLITVRVLRRPDGDLGRFEELAECAWRGRYTRAEARALVRETIEQAVERDWQRRVT